MSCAAYHIVCDVFLVEIESVQIILNEESLFVYILNDVLFDKFVTDCLDFRALIIAYLIVEPLKDLASKAAFGVSSEPTISVVLEVDFFVDDFSP